MASNKGATPGNYASGATAYYKNATATDYVAWYSSNSGSSTKEVGLKQANGLGLYDISGNVWEWCWDRYDYYPAGSQSNYKGAGTGLNRVKRGGYIGGENGTMRVGARYYSNPSKADDYYGFRVTRSAL